MLWAAACLCLFGFFCGGEITIRTNSEGTFEPKLHLSWGDITVDDTTRPWVLQGSLKRSKYDQFGQGVKVYIKAPVTVLRVAVLCAKSIWRTCTASWAVAVIYRSSFCSTSLVVCLVWPEQVEARLTSLKQVWSAIILHSGTLKLLGFCFCGFVL